MSDNIFAKIIKGEIKTDFLFENEGAVIIADIKPEAKHHYLVLPKKNYVDLKEFLNKASQEEKNLFFEAVQSKLNELPHAKVKFNCGKGAGQEIMYLHAHILSD